MFGGEYKHNLDAKNRIFVPSKLREELANALVVVKDLRETCLKVYSPEGWEEYLKPIRQQNRRLQEKVMRFLNSSMAQLTPDSQGRITLPRELVEYAEIKDSAVVVGCGDYAEIWAEEVYDQIKEEIDLEEMISELEELGL